MAAAPQPSDLARLAPAAIDRLIGSVTFHRTKAGSIREIARAAAARPDGELPCDAEVLLALPGVGPKCAHLALGIACGERRISVDIHVHRVTNRWGYVRAPTPERTMTPWCKSASATAFASPTSMQTKLACDSTVL